MNKAALNIPDYVKEELAMKWVISQEPMDMNEEHERNIIELLVLEDKSSQTEAQKIIDAYTFVREGGGFDYFYGASTYEELAKLIVAFDTDNKDEGYRGSIFGTLPKEWATYIDVSKLATALTQDNRLTFLPESRIALRIW